MRAINNLLFLAVFLLIGVSGANASVSHDHHDHQKSVSNSPFDGKSNSQSLHCPLNKSHHKGQFCPHTHARNSNKELRLAADCGGNPNGTVPVPQGFGKINFLDSEKFSPLAFGKAGSIISSSVYFPQTIPDEIDHPPDRLFTFSA